MYLAEMTSGGKMNFHFAAFSAMHRRLIRDAASASAFSDFASAFDRSASDSTTSSTSAADSADDVNAGSGANERVRDDESAVGSATAIRTSATAAANAATADATAVDAAAIGEGGSVGSNRLLQRTSPR